MASVTHPKKLNVRKLMVCLDCSPSSEYALAEAMRMAFEYPSLLVLVSVLSPPHWWQHALPASVSGADAIAVNMLPSTQL